MGQNRSLVFNSQTEIFVAGCGVAAMICAASGSMAMVANGYIYAGILFAMSAGYSMFGTFVNLGTLKGKQQIR